MKMDVVFYEVFEEERLALKKFLPRHIKASFHSKPPSPGSPLKAPAPLISIRTHSKIPSSWSKDLRGILTRSQGYDHLLMYREKTSFKGTMGYLGNYCARAVAEHVLMSLLALWRKLELQQKSFAAFGRDGLTGREMTGRTACVIGVGNIGLEIAGLLKGAGLRVIGVDLVKRSKTLKYVSLKQAVRQADVIICALPLTDRTRGLLNYRLLQDIRPGSLFINVSRGEIAPIGGLKKLLEQGLLSGLALDIYEDERVLAECLRGGRRSMNPAVNAILELKDRGDVLFTPHNAFNTEEALAQKARRSAEAVGCFLKRGKFPHEVPIR